MVLVCTLLTYLSKDIYFNYLSLSYKHLKTHLSL